MFQLSTSTVTGTKMLSGSYNDKDRNNKSKTVKELKRNPTFVCYMPESGQDAGGRWCLVRQVSCPTL